MNYLGSVEEEGLDIMRPLGIFLENCRSLRAWKIWAIWIKRVKLGIGRDEGSRGSGTARPRQRSCGEHGATLRASGRRFSPSLPFPGSPNHRHCAASPAPRCPSACPAALHRASQGVEAALGQRLALGRASLVAQRVGC